MKKIIFLAIVLIYGCESRKGEQFNYLSKKELSQHQIGDIILQPTEFNGHRAEQGIILVKENWFSENQKLVQIPVFRVFTNNEQKKEPIFIFHGGPGLTNIVTGSISDWMLENHDVILLGYRGVDGEFVLHSKKANIFWRKEKNPMSEESLKKMMNILDNEIEKLVKKGIDINGYGIQNIIEDIETARKSLGYTKINLSGGSYGTAIQELYSVKYPQNINRMILNAPVFFWNIVYNDSREKGAIDEEQKDALSKINEEWQKDSLCLTKSKDIVQTIKNVFQKLPQKYANVYISADKLRAATHVLMFNQSSMVQLLDAYIAAENGDYSGIATMVFTFNSIPTFMNVFDLMYKTISSHTESFEYIKPNSNDLIGSPLSELAWGGFPYMRSKTPYIPDSLAKIRSINTETLFIFAGNDVGKAVTSFFDSMYIQPKIVVLKNMGHADSYSFQQEAFVHLQKRFLLEGVADTSKYVPAEFEKINFVPTTTFQETGKKYKRNILLRTTTFLMHLKERLF